MAGAEELALRKAKSHTSLSSAAVHAGRMSSNSSSGKKLGSGGLMGRMLSMVGRKHGKSENKDVRDSMILIAGPFERASYIDVVETDVDDLDLDLEDLGEEDNPDVDAHDLLDEEFKELQQKEIEFRSKYYKKIQVKELEQKEKDLTEQLKQLELREIQLKGERLKGQLKEMQIKELRLKERHLIEEREMEMEMELRSQQRERQLRLDKSLPEITPQRSPNLTLNVNLDKSLPDISPEQDQEAGKSDFEFEFGIIGDRGSGGSARGSGKGSGSGSGSVTPPLSRSPLNKDKALPMIVPIDDLKPGTESPIPFTYKSSSTSPPSNTNKSLPEIKDVPIVDKSLPEIRSSINSIDSIQEVDEEHEGALMSKRIFPEPRLDFITPSSSILNRRGNGNSFSNNNSLEELPEPQIYDTPNQSLLSVHTDRPLNELNETLQTCASHIKFDLYQTSSRILTDSKNGKNSAESHNSEQTLRNNSSSSSKNNGLNLKMLEEKLGGDSKATEYKGLKESKFKASEAMINGNGQRNSNGTVKSIGVQQDEEVTSSVSTIDPKSRVARSSTNSISSLTSSSRAKKRENRKITVKHAMAKKSRPSYSSVKVKIYNKIHDDDEVIAMRVSKDKIEDIDYLINAILKKIDGVSGEAPSVALDNIKLSLVSKSTRINPVMLTPENGSRLSSGIIMNYVLSKDKIYVQAERERA